MRTLLLKQEEDEDEEEVDPSMVEYFFDVLVDEEIDDLLLCELTAEERDVKNIFSDVYKKCVPGGGDDGIGNVYRTEVGEIEDCD